ncbi:hypothetical protein [uncultured Treponema sp.]|uniref:hypothetical protein n=1 Tax=uncultured Treponema sp. TaxID=162155 RepID=UPI0025F354F9|nr:hypothetical protein [uncultured Treponema sp.]
MRETKTLTNTEKWESLTLANNFIFYKVMRHHPDACKHLIEMLLGIKIEKMEMHNEEVIDIDHDFKHFFIAPTCAKMIQNEEIRSFFNFLISNTANSRYTSMLSGYVNNAKHNMQWRVQYMTFARQQYYAFQDGKQAGIAEGEQQKAIEDAVMLVRDFNIEPKLAAEKIHAPLDKVLEALQQEITAKS